LSSPPRPALAPAAGAAGPEGGDAGGGGGGGDDAAGALVPAATAAGAAATAAAPAPGAGGVVRISLPALHKYADGEDEIMRQLIGHYGVPREARFELLCRVRVARAFGSLEGRRRAVRHRLQALCLLLHSAPQQGARRRSPWRV
jgi:hypothetical protein